MLTERDIDILQQQIQDGQKPTLYYLCHFIETREGYIDEAHYKSIPRFKVLEIKINKIENAYFEYLNFVNNEENYHVESEIEHYDEFTTYIHYYTVPNKEKVSNGITTVMPSAIYGYRRQTIQNGEVISDYSDKSPIIPIYTNDIIYGDLKGDDLTAALDNKKLDWKYLKLDKPAKVDAVGEYHYVTSDWYVIECENFPRTEHILINTHDKTAYFRDIHDAFNFKAQCEA